MIHLPHSPPVFLVIGFGHPRLTSQMIEGNFISVTHCCLGFIKKLSCCVKSRQTGWGRRGLTEIPLSNNSLSFHLLMSYFSLSSLVIFLPGNKTPQRLLCIPLQIKNEHLLPHNKMHATPWGIGTRRTWKRGPSVGLSVYPLISVWQLQPVQQPC